MNHDECELRIYSSGLPSVIWMNSDFLSPFHVDILLTIATKSHDQYQSLKGDPPTSAYDRGWKIPLLIKAEIDEKEPSSRLTDPD